MSALENKKVLIIEENFQHHLIEACGWKQQPC